MKFSRHYDTRVVIYDHKTFITLVSGLVRLPRVGIIPTTQYLFIKCTSCISTTFAKYI